MEKQTQIMLAKRLLALVDANATDMADRQQRTPISQ